MKQRIGPDLEPEGAPDFSIGKNSGALSDPGRLQPSQPDPNESAASYKRATDALDRALRKGASRQLGPIARQQGQQLLRGVSKDLPWIKDVVEVAKVTGKVVAVGAGVAAGGYIACRSLGRCKI
jgi:hypothetical protein